MKKSKMGLPSRDITDTDADRIAEFHSGLRETIDGAKAAFTRDARSDELLTRTTHMIETTYAVGYLDGIIALIKTVREYAEQFDVLMVGGMDLDALESYVIERLEYPVPEGINMDEVIRGALTFFYKAGEDQTNDY